MPPTSEEIAELIAGSNSLWKAYEIYRANKNLLAGWKFIFSSETGSIPGYAVNKIFSNGAAVCSLFASEHVVVLDIDTVSDMEKGEAKFFIDFSISLDTQALSYIRPYINGVKNLPPDLQEVMQFMARPEVNVDPLPYLLENSRSILYGSNNERQHIFESLVAYELLRSIDKARLNKGELQSYLSEAERALKAQELLSEIAFSHSREGFQDELLRKRRIMYCLLLKMVEIQFRRKQSSIDDKIMEFLRFLDTKVAIMFVREALLAVRYFHNGQKGFFKNIQKKSPKLLRNLQNMSWDLWHIRQCEEGFSVEPDKPARYYFPAFLTFDKNLAELFALCPMKLCVVDPAGTIQPIYAGDQCALMAGGSKELTIHIEKEFYSDAARKERQARRESKKTYQLPYVNKLIDELEIKLLKIAEIDPVGKQT